MSLYPQLPAFGVFLPASQACVEHVVRAWMYLEGAGAQPPPLNRINFCSGLSSLNSFAKTTYRDGDLEGEGDAPPLKKLGGGDGGAFILNI